MKNRFRFLKVVVAAVAVAFQSAAFAANVDVDHNKNDIAIKGYDPVAYFTKSEATRGEAKYSAVHNGAIYHFSSAKNRDRFRADPARYAPQYGGFCAFGVTKHRKFSADPEAWKIVDGKLYLNLNKKVQSIWLEDVPGNIASAEEIWPGLLGYPDAQLAKR